MASHESLVDLIFAKLGLVYGRDFLSRWEGQNLEEVKADWQRELCRVLDHPESVRYALENLPADARPPNVLQFRALCIGRPEPELKRLAAPRATDAAVAEAVSKAIAPKPKVDGKEWARRLRTEEQGGHRITAAQRMMWRAALATDMATEAAA